MDAQRYVSLLDFLQNFSSFSPFTLTGSIRPLYCGGRQRVEEQKCWRTASNSVRIATDVLQDSETESAESMSQE